MHKAALEIGVGIHPWQTLHQVHHSSKHDETHSDDCVGEALPLTGDVHHLKLHLRGGKLGVRCLRLKLAQLDLAKPPLLLLWTSSNRLLLLIVLISNGS